MCKISNVVQITIMSEAVIFYVKFIRSGYDFARWIQIFSTRSLSLRVIYFMRADLFLRVQVN